MTLEEFLELHITELHNVIRRRNNKIFLTELELCTQNIDQAKPSVSQRAWHVMHKVHGVPVCKTCKDKKVKWHKNKKAYQVYCSPKCSNSDPDKIALTKENNIRKWGVDNPKKVPMFSKPTKRKEKKVIIKKTKEEIIANRRLYNLNKYGVEWHTQSPEVKSKISSTVKLTTEEAQEKRKATMLERYGVESYSQHPDCANKRRRSCMEKYGVEHPMQTVEVKEKLATALMDKYGTDNVNKIHIPPDVQEKMTDKNWLENEHQTKSIEAIAKELGINSSNLCVIFRKFEIELKSHQHSDFENEIYNFIGSKYGGIMIRNSREIISPKELDIYLPELNLAIECNGIYWHSELAGGKNKNYHMLKTKQCNELGIHLIHITDLEWNSKTDIIKSMLESLIRSNTRIFARKCSIVTSHGPSLKIKEFLLKNHIQGYSCYNYALCLMFGEEMVQVMTFGKPRFTKSAEYELIRLSTKNGYNIVGGASKLFSSFLKVSDPCNVVSYSESDHFSGGIYDILGFEQIGDPTPTYLYVDKNYNYTQSRYKFQKSKLHKVLENFDENQSEWENMKANGYDRYWRPGSKTYIYKHKEKKL